MCERLVPRQQPPAQVGSGITGMDHTVLVRQGLAGCCAKWKGGLGALVWGRLRMTLPTGEVFLVQPQQKSKIKDRSDPKSLQPGEGWLFPHLCNCNRCMRKGETKTWCNDFLSLSCGKCQPPDWHSEVRGTKAGKCQKLRNLKQESSSPSSHAAGSPMEIEMKVWYCTAKERLPFGAGPGTSRVTAVLSTETGGYVEGGGGTGTCVWLALNCKEMPLVLHCYFTTVLTVCRQKIATICTSFLLLQMLEHILHKN